jgi:hypothetical protein
VRKAILLIGIPAVLVAFLVADGVGSSHSAEISITADHPTEFRETVLATVRSLGGDLVGEDTSFGGRGSSKLTFSVPTVRLEQALDALGDLGGQVTDQQVDLSDATAQAQSMSDRLDALRGCLADAGNGDASLSQCRDDLDAASAQLRGAQVDLERSELVVDVEASGVSNPALVVAVVLLIAAAIGGAVLVWRVARPAAAPAVDLRHYDDFEDDDDLHLRRN